MCRIHTSNIYIPKPTPDPPKKSKKSEKPKKPEKLLPLQLTPPVKNPTPPEPPVTPEPPAVSKPLVILAPTIPYYETIVKDPWHSTIYSNGDIEISIQDESMTIRKETIISLIEKHCPKGDRFAEVHVEARLYAKLLREVENRSFEIYNLCALYAALRSSGAYDSPYGGGRNSVFNVPAYLGCSRSPLYD